MAESDPTEKKDFFISYNKADREWAEWIAQQLRFGHAPRDADLRPNYCRLFARLSHFGLHRAGVVCRFRRGQHRFQAEARSSARARLSEAVALEHIVVASCAARYHKPARELRFERPRLARSLPWSFFLAQVSSRYHLLYFVSF